MSADRISADRISDVTVLVADDQRLVREGIASLLNIQEGIRVVGQAVNGQEAIEKALALSPDVILMDVRMPVVDGIVATAQIHRQLPGCQVIMLTTFDDEEYIVKSLRAGAVGYLLKDIPAAQLARAVQLAHAGIYQLDPAVAGKLVGMLGSAQPERSPLPAPAADGGNRKRSHGARAGSAAPHRNRRHQSGDRRSAGGQRGHGQEPRLQYPQPARAARSDTGGAVRPRTWTGVEPIRITAHAARTGVAVHRCEVSARVSSRIATIGEPPLYDPHVPAFQVSTVSAASVEVPA